MPKYDWRRREDLTEYQLLSPSHLLLKEHFLRVTRGKGNPSSYNVKEGNLMRKIGLATIVAI